VSWAMAGLAVLRLFGLIHGHPARPLVARGA
jgi:hypothetical protein